MSPTFPSPNQIDQRHAAVLIFLRHRHDEAKIAPHEFFHRLVLAHANSTRENLLTVGCEKWNRLTSAKYWSRMSRSLSAGRITVGTERRQCLV